MLHNLHINIAYSYVNCVTRKNLDKHIYMHIEWKEIYVILHIFMYNVMSTDLGIGKLLGLQQFKKANKTGE